MKQISYKTEMFNIKILNMITFRYYCPNKYNGSDKR